MRQEQARAAAAGPQTPGPEDESAEIGDFMNFLTTLMIYLLLEHYWVNPVGVRVGLRSDINSSVPAYF